MDKRTITYRVDAQTRKAQIHRWKSARIEEGLRQADAGKFATDREVTAAFARWRSPSGPSADIKL